jgi:hypothetical protein
MIYGQWSSQGPCGKGFERIGEAYVRGARCSQLPLGGKTVNVMFEEVLWPWNDQPPCGLRNGV